MRQFGAPHVHPMWRELCAPLLWPILLLWGTGWLKCGWCRRRLKCATSVGASGADWRQWRRHRVAILTYKVGQTLPKKCAKKCAKKAPEPISSTAQKFVTHPLTTYVNEHVEWFLVSRREKLSHFLPGNKGSWLKICSTVHSMEKIFNRDARKHPLLLTNV